MWNEFSSLSAANLVEKCVLRFRRNRLFEEGCFYWRALQLQFNMQKNLSCRRRALGL